MRRQHPALFILALFILQAMMEKNDYIKAESDDSKKKTANFFRVFSNTESFYVNKFNMLSVFCHLLLGLEIVCLSNAGF